MKTKTFLLAMLMIAFNLIGSTGIQGQTTQPTLNQKELMKHFLGTWQSTVGKDTLEIWESKLYGDAVIITVSQTIKGKTTALYMNNTGFDARDGKLKGFILNHDGSYSTWIGAFSTDKIFSGELLDSFSPEKPWSKFAFEFVSPKEWLFTLHNNEGVKTGEYKFSKVK